MDSDWLTQMISPEFNEMPTKKLTNGVLQGYNSHMTEGTQLEDEKKLSKLLNLLNFTTFSSKR